MELGTGQELSGGNLLKLSSFVLWSLLYFYTGSCYPDKSPEWCSRAVTVLHGSVATVAGLAQCQLQNLDKCRLTMKMIPSHYMLMLWSWGYFAFDLLWCLVYWSESKVMLCHHASALVAINIYMGKDNPGCTFACTLAMLEITNPLLQMRWFLKNAGYGDRVVFYVVEVTYLLLFLFIRGVLGTFVVYLVLGSDVFQLDQKLLCVQFYLVSLALVYQILGFVFYKYRSKIDEFRGFLVEFGATLNDQL